MIPFPGESLGIDVALDVDTMDESLYDSIRRRGAIGSAPATRTLGAGEWRVWVYPGGQEYLEDDTTDVVVSWVVEVATGTGTITASMGLDPDFGDPAAAHPTDLGSHAVAGATTLVLPTTLTAADVMTGDDSMMLVLTCTGSVVVQQVKLRVWPTLGVAGGWSGPQTGFTPGPVPPISWWHEFTRNGSASDATVEDAWATARTTQTGGPPSGVKAFDDEWGGVGLGATGTIYKTSAPPYLAEASTRTALVVLVGPDWRTAYPISGEFVEGVDYIRPPEEVPEDFDAWVQRVGDGYVTWPDDDITLLVHGTDQAFGGPTVHATTVDDLTVTNPTFTTAEISVDLGGETPAIITHPSSGATTQANAALSLTVGRYGVVTLSHTFASGEGGPWVGGTPSVLGTFTSAVGDYTPILGDGLPDEPTFRPVMAQANLPAYRMWLPEIVTATLSKVRQFHRDDGLGVTPPRAFGGASRIRTGRAYGYD